MKKTLIIIFEIILIPAMASLLFAAEKAENDFTLSKEPQKGCVELAERLEVENTSRGQFSGDINFYRRNTADIENKDEFLIHKNRL